MPPLVLAIDQGTTRTKALVFDAGARPLFETGSEVRLGYPQPGWVESDAVELLASVVNNGRTALQGFGAGVVAMGLANQGETVVAWNRITGTPVYKAIGWQDRRTDSACERLRLEGHEQLIRARTGLPLDPYFSATKIAWILDHVPGARALADQGTLLAGTTDAWLLWNLVGRHVTDHSTASRTMLYNSSLRDWDVDVLRVLRIPIHILPEIVATDSRFGTVRPEYGFGAVDLMASVVDQQGALFGQVCFHPGDIKVTFGTGAFILQHAGDRAPHSEHGLVPTVAWALGRHLEYALDGGIYVAGAAAQWLRDGLGIVGDVSETADLAASVPDTGDVFVVPALAGLAAPYWDSYARGTIVGITRGTNRAHIARATLEGIAFRTRDVVDAMASDTGFSASSIKVDGGASDNVFLMQTLADVLQAQIRVAAIRETTALGVAFLAGLSTGIWLDQETIAGLWGAECVYEPDRIHARSNSYHRWKDAVRRSRGWARPEIQTL